MLQLKGNREWWGLWQMDHRWEFMKGAPTTQIHPIAERRKTQPKHIQSSENCEEKSEIQIFI